MNSLCSPFVNMHTLTLGLKVPNFVVLGDAAWGTILGVPFPCCKSNSSFSNLWLCLLAWRPPRGEPRFGLGFHIHLSYFIPCITRIQGEVRHPYYQHVVLQRRVLRCNWVFKIACGGSLRNGTKSRLSCCPNLTVSYIIIVHWCSV